MKKTLLAAMAAMALAAPAQAAKMEVTFFKNLPTVYIGGDIEKGDGAQFSKLTARFQPGAVMVVLNSNGGLLGEGLDIGLLIRQKRWTTVVFEQCASTCGLMWLAGSTRIVDVKGRVGFHSVFDIDTKAVSSNGNAIVGGYLKLLGFSWGAISYFTEAAPDGMAWLTEAKAKELGVGFKSVQVKRADTTVPTKQTVSTNPEPVPVKQTVTTGATPAPVVAIPNVKRDEPEYDPKKTVKTLRDKQEEIDNPPPPKQTVSTDTEAKPEPVPVKQTTTTVVKQTKTDAEAKPVCEVNIEKYKQLQMGMTYSEVIETLGCDGTEISTSEGVGYKIEQYNWQGLSVTLTNGKVIAKTQNGLK
jgi:hypothetical protein